MIGTFEEMMYKLTMKKKQRNEIKKTMVKQSK